MIEHVSIRCRNVPASRQFYEKVLAPLGYHVSMAYPGAVGFMAEGHTSFWISEGKVGNPPAHIAFRASNRKKVDAFHRRALKAGAKNNGDPALRPDYSRTYYAAFVLDPDGHNIEAVSFAAGPRKKTAKKAKRK
jgi:catechol 2,3-dioxygenase-like lactoylglutathione lyase family enzyme